MQICIGEILFENKESVGSTFSRLQLEVRVCCSQIFMILSPCPPTKSSRALIIIFIVMEISLFTIWSIYHLSSSSEAQWPQ